MATSRARLQLRAVVLAESVASPGLHACLVRHRTRRAIAAGPSSSWRRATLGRGFWRCPSSSTGSGTAAAMTSTSYAPEHRTCAMWQPGQLDPTTMRNRIEAGPTSAGQRWPDRDPQGPASACTPAYRPLPPAPFQRSAAPAPQGPAPLSFRRQNKKNQELTRSARLPQLSPAGRLATIGGVGCPALRDHDRHHEGAACYGHQRPAADATFLPGGARAAVSRRQPACTGAQRQHLTDHPAGVRRVPVSVTRALSAMGGTFRGDGRA